MRKELEERLVDFCVMILEISDHVRKDHPGYHLIDQVIRSSTSAALNYGEAQGAESKRDFIHKSALVHKELRESHINLRIMKNSGLIKNNPDLEKAIDECNQLVAIFFRIVQTAKKNI